VCNKGIEKQKLRVENENTHPRWRKTRKREDGEEEEYEGSSIYIISI
jgi:hypothetical protein